MFEMFADIVGKENVLQNEPMSNHTTFKIGGPADYFVMPENPRQVRNVYLAAKERGVPVFIMGNGSNLVVGDRGIRGVVICLFKRMDSIVIEGEKVTVGCGALLSKVAATVCREGLAGFEFASGIPGTVGGGVYMNAGAYGPELKDIILSVSYMDQEGNFGELAADKCEFGYRTSIFGKKGYIILGCTFGLTRGNSEEIRELINEYTKRRTSKQPIEKPSAGSVFKRPEGYFAGTLIEGAGLKGFTIGGAQVSEKHAGFIVNIGTATAKDVMDLIAHIQKTVYEKDGIKLETEVKLVGEF